MSRTIRSPAAPELSLHQLLDALEAGAITLDDALQQLGLLRASSPAAAAAVDRALASEALAARPALREARAKMEEMGRLLQKLTAPPLHVGICLEVLLDGDRARAVIQHGNTSRVVAFGEDVDPDELAPGDRVFLSDNLNVIVAVADGSASAVGETACFDRHLPGGRLVVKSRDEEHVLLAGRALRGDGLRPGDLLRFDRGSMVALERLERTAGSQHFLEETPSDGFESIGGLGAQIEKLVHDVSLHLAHGDVARRYGLRPVRSYLLVGPPGNGKTKLAQGLASHIGRHSPTGRSKFLSIRPGALLSMWYGQSEANVREVFRVAREAAAREPGVPVVLFFDEVDSLGGARDQLSFRADRGALLAFAAELNGLESRGDVIVLAATNRQDLLDPSLNRAGGRLCDEVIVVPRPDRGAALEILAKHLPVAAPYAGSQPSGDTTAARGEIIDGVVTRIYAPNGAGEIATLVFRDGKRRPVMPTDLVSGALLANVARKAAERAARREIDTGACGIALEDALAAVEEDLTAAANVLTRANCRSYIADLPADVDVVDVLRPKRRVERPHRFLEVS